MRTIKQMLFILILLLIGLNISCRKTNDELSFISIEQTEEYYYSEGYILLKFKVSIKNENKFTFSDITIYNSFTDKYTVYDVNSNNKCSVSTTLEDNTWTTNIYFSLSFENVTSFEGNLKVTEIRFLNNKSEKVLVDFDENEKQTFNIHLHSYNKEITTNDYLAEEATHFKPAKYYYSCECGKKGSDTFEAGNVIPHNFIEGNCECGEVDPNFVHVHNYIDGVCKCGDIEPQKMSLKELREQYGTIEAGISGKDSGKEVAISGVVARLDGISSAYIQEYSEVDNVYYGVYVYGGFNNYPELKLGNFVSIEGKISYYFGNLQITDIKITVESYAPSDPNSVINIEYITDNSVININNPMIIGSLVNVSDLTVTGGSDGNDNSFTIKTEYIDETGKTIILNIRVTNNINLTCPDGRILSYRYFEGKTIKSITAIVSYYDRDIDDSYNGYIQLMLTSFNDIILDE